MIGTIVGIAAWLYYHFIKIYNDLRTEFAVMSAVLIAMLFYALRICLRNYNILKHLIHSNKHRANVAQTLENFINSAGSDTELKSVLIKEGASAMFQSDSTGYLTKDQMEITTPVKELITTFISGNTK